jgi:hypothetical protein
MPFNKDFSNWWHEEAASYHSMVGGGPFPSGMQVYARCRSET